MISLLSIIPIRRDASESSEMVSQLLFGEKIEVLEADGNWTRVRTSHDQYEGWVDTKMLTESDNMAVPHNIVTSFTATLQCNGITFPITMGALLPSFSGKTISLGGVEFDIVDGTFSSSSLDTDVALSAISQLKNAPYLWGGRSTFGIDCSGLSQLFYRLIGKSIPRDASQQITLGDDVFLSEAEPGDLAFFEKDGRITHVGILIDNSTIIHASGWVRVDAIDANGIYLKDEQKYSHKLVGVKRL